MRGSLTSDAAGERINPMMIKRSAELKRSTKRIERRTAPRKHRVTRPGTGPSDEYVLDLLKQAVRLRDPKCVVCNKLPTFDTMHLIGRSARRVRYSLLNVLGGCRQCHTHFTKHSTEWKAWWRDHVGPKVVQQIEAESTDMTTQPDRQAAADILRAYIKEHRSA